MVAGARTFSLEETFLSPQILNPPPTRHALLTFLLALTAVLHIGTAAWGDLYDGAEGHLAGGARELLDSKQWLLPTNNGAPLLETPPFAFWTVALSCKIFGGSAAAARLPIALAMLGSVGLTFLIGERLAGYWRGFAAGLIQLCSAGAFLPGRMVTPDAIFSLFIAAAIYCAVRGYQHRNFRRAWFAGFWLAASLASLTKGPSALFYLGAIFGGLSIFFREARLRFRPLLHWMNVALFLLLVVPWYVWAHRNFPGFLAYFFEWDDPANLQRGRFLLWHFAWWFPAIFFILPALILVPRKIFRPGETTFADALPLAWLAVGLLWPLLPGERQVFSSLAAAAGFALFAAVAWERSSRNLHFCGIALALLVGVAIGAVTYFRPAIAAVVLERPINESAGTSFAPLVAIAVGSLVIFFVGALLIMKQPAEVILVVALVAMVPIGFCLVEGRSRAAPFFSLADAAQMLNPRLTRGGEVVYEGSLRDGTSMSFYLQKKFFLVNQTPAFFERGTASGNKYVDEHFLLEAWDGS
ncbi:MAG TPA: glycosyltransferase family 39 protein, partial [Chthoniobacterales bacterium]|nr:glycosyltransferase family 39 protein [Chthoniobacterales bacterium]